MAAHNWQPWAFNPHTGLVYIPEQEIGFPYKGDPDFKPATKGDQSRPRMPWERSRRSDPEGHRSRDVEWKGALIAWDPVQQQPRWRVDHAGRGMAERSLDRGQSRRSGPCDR